MAQADGGTGEKMGTSSLTGLTAIAKRHGGASLGAFVRPHRFIDSTTVVEKSYHLLVET